jgi:hypothetical protein
MNDKKSYKDNFRSRFQDYADEVNRKKAFEWLKKNLNKVKQLTSDTPVSKFIFEPFSGVFKTKSDIVESDVYGIITKVAIINMVLAGIPGRLGIGVFVSIGFEIVMAFKIAQYVGFKEIKSYTDIGRYLGLATGVLLSTFQAFKIFIGLAISVFSTVWPYSPIIIAELFVTNMFGLIFLFGFQNIMHSKSFNDIKFYQLFSMTKKLTQHQWSLVKNVANKDNLKSIAKIIKEFLVGDFPVDQKVINGEVFSTAAMAYLIGGQYEKLDGPLGEAFMQSIRLRWSSQLGETATIEEISEHFQQYNISQLEGVTNTIKGKMFEILITDQENSDNDSWTAKMHENESFPGSDIIFHNSETNETLEVSLKAVSADNSFIIEDALAKYPNLPIMSTDEVADLYADNPNVFGSGFTNKELDGITDEKLQILISQMEPINAKEVVVGGITMSTFAALWPFVMAYLRGRITREQLELVFFQVMGDSGVKLVSRLSWAVVLGPMFAWWLLARGVGGMVDMAATNTFENEKTTKISFIAITN